MNLEIRKEATSDYAAVYELNRLAFGQEAESRLVDALRKTDLFIPELSIVAAINNQVVGHILFTIIHIENENSSKDESLALAPMAVMPKLQRQGIGSMLIKTGLERAKELGYKSVIVLGHEQYYPKFGFAPASRWNIKPPFDVPDNVFMAIELVPDALKNVSGTVVYPKEFEAV